MKFFPRLLLGFLFLTPFALHAQQPDAATLAKAVQQFLKSSKDPWIKHYEALQKQEAAWFGMKEFKKAWDINESNLTISGTGKKDLPWKLRFDPEFPGEKHHPVWLTYDLSTCLYKPEMTATVLDFDLLFFMDSTWVVKKMQPGIEMLDEGRHRHLGPTAIAPEAWNSCMKIRLSNLEKSTPMLVGNRWKETASFIADCESRRDEINSAIESALKAKYTTAPVDHVETCPGTAEECFEFTDPAVGKIETEGIFTATSGPQTLFYKAIISVADKVTVKIENIWK
jgi:hypothetical protein